MITDEKYTAAGERAGEHDALELEEQDAVQAWFDHVDVHGAHVDSARGRRLFESAYNATYELNSRYEDRKARDAEILRGAA